MLSSALAELVVEGVKKKEVEEKDVSEGLIPIDETKKEMIKVIFK